MKLIILLSLASCGIFDVRGIGHFGQVRKMRFKIVKQNISGDLIEEELRIPYVKSNIKSCFPPTYQTHGQIYTVKYEDHQAVMYNMLNKHQSWYFKEENRNGKVDGISKKNQKVETATCRIEYFYNIIFSFDKMYVSFVKEKS